MLQSNKEDVQATLTISLDPGAFFSLHAVQPEGSNLNEFMDWVEHVPVDGIGKLLFRKVPLRFDLSPVFAKDCTKHLVLHRKASIEHYVRMHLHIMYSSNN
jgi:hypothetical protein